MTSFEGRQADLPPGPVANPAQPHEDVSEKSIGDLLGEISRDLSVLMRQEVELATAEIKQEVAKTGKGAGMLAGAGFAGYMVLLFASIALWAGLSNVIDAGWSALIVMAIWAVIAVVLGVSGRTRLRAVHPKPERTVDTLKRVPDALKGQ
ncbi:phage holin family protein [Labedaea rhizosphaerae]|uniref:Putative superfamily III holin-X n=1 Tax=Labedaea rhizosphaerae TaxID=598644 RepID=A0A4R6SFM4_LABRH|nr:phage holin family protein [Labedaea rhizosphaerae]TDQ00297.1 putative superfamily III holin-X [Labedaea rhizosphaerae]